MNVYHWQGLTFRQKALYELKQELKHKKRQQAKKKWRTYWVEVQFVNGEQKWYQCSRDLQGALWQYTAKEKKPANLNGVLLNVPIAPYAGTKTPIRTAMVMQTKIKRNHTKDTSMITRGQFFKLDYNRFGFPKDLANKIRYMQHDYSNVSKYYIEDNIRYFATKNSGWLYKILAFLWYID